MNEKKLSTERCGSKQDLIFWHSATRALLTSWFNTEEFQAHCMGSSITVKQIRQAVLSAKILSSNWKSNDQILNIRTLTFYWTFYLKCKDSGIKTAPTPVLPITLTGKLNMLLNKHHLDLIMKSFCCTNQELLGQCWLATPGSPVLHILEQQLH